MIRYQARIKKDGDSNFVEFPGLPGCFSEGVDREEALEGLETQEPGWWSDTTRVSPSRASYCLQGLSKPFRPSGE